MPETAAVSANIGFMTILRETAGFVGGYLVTNLWGRPLEFRLSSPVQANKVQQILFGDALEGYICADLIGRTLFEKSQTAVHAILSDHPAVLDLRLHISAPVAWYRGEHHEHDRRGIAVTDLLSCHASFPEDVNCFKGLLERLGNGFDLAEPFDRVREALGEARKLGASRAA